MGIRVLGPLDVVDEAGSVVRLAAKQRRLLAALVADRGRSRPADALAEALWRDRPPPNAAKVLQVYVSRLRKALPGGIRVRTQDAGYALELDDDSLDSANFERLLAEARALSAEGNASLAVSLLGRALALWRGEAFGELAYEDFARPEAERLEELRLLALEEQFDAQLHLARHAAVLGELRELALAQPLRERVQTQLMLALYRCGRQADALEVYRSVRSRLHDQLGLEPGPELREMERRILSHDPVLGSPEPSEQRPPELRTPATALLGRERELGELREILARRQARLLVLTGAGGSGKTRLALEVARENAGSFANGAVLVELAPLRDPELVPAAIRAALGLSEQPGDQLETLAAALRSHELLLVLDNAEHLRAAAPLYSELLARLPRLTLLVTSRSVLHLSGEQVYPVEPLAAASASRLFVERARQADSRSCDDAFEATIIAGICDRLDRLPLAIEIAAGRTRTLTAAEVLERLDRRLALLTGGHRDLPARQQTLRATLEWSYDLLDEQEQRAFARLAVFAGAFTLDAAEAICETTVERLAALVDQHLIQRNVATDGDAAARRRFFYLETIREFALERCDERAELDELQRRHAIHFLRAAERAAPELEGPDARMWLDAVGEDYDNLRAALAWCLEAAELELGTRLASAVLRFWIVRGHLAEGRRSTDELLRQSSNAPPPVRAELLKVASVLANESGDDAALKDHSRRRLELARESGNRSEVAACLNNLGLVAYREGDLSQSASWFQQSLSLERELGERTGIATGNLARVLTERGELEQAEALAAESRALGQERGDLEQVADMTEQTGWIRLLQGRLEEAVEIERHVLRLIDELDYKDGFRSCCEFLAIVHARCGNAARAGQLLGKANLLRDELGDGPSHPLLDNARARTRSLLGNEALGEATSAGRSADVRDLLRTALDEAGAAIRSARR